MGRPARSDRHLALLVLISFAAQQAMRIDKGRELRYRNYPRCAGWRELVRETIDLEPPALTKALAKAKERGLYARTWPGKWGPAGAKLPPSVPGQMTPAGWRALGEVPPDWLEHVGSTWDIPEIHFPVNARIVKEALRVLRHEILLEANEIDKLKKIRRRQRAYQVADEWVEKQDDHGQVAHQTTDSR